MFARVRVTDGERTRQKAKNVVLRFLVVCGPPSHPHPPLPLHQVLAACRGHPECLTRLQALSSLLDTALLLRDDDEEGEGDAVTAALTSAASRLHSELQ